MKIVALKDFSDSQEQNSLNIVKTKTGKRKRVTSRFKQYKKGEEYSVEKKLGDRFIDAGVARPLRAAAT